MNQDFIIEDGVLKKYVGAGGAVCIPENVKRIGYMAFMGANGSHDIISITIPDSVLYIESWAFFGLSLKSLTIPDSVECIEDGALCGLWALEDLVLPETPKFEQINWFGCWFEGDNFPKNLFSKINYLEPYMDDSEFKRVVAKTSIWKKLSVNRQAAAYIYRRNTKLRKRYQKLIKPGDTSEIGNEIIKLLSDRLSAKEGNAVKEFLLDYYAYLSDAVLLKLYERLENSGRKAAFQEVDACKDLKAKITLIREKSNNSKGCIKNDPNSDSSVFESDAQVEKVYDLGSFSVKILLQPDLSLCVVNELTGKKTKSIPKKAADPERYTIVSSDFSALKKKVKADVRKYRDIAIEQFLNGESIDIDTWRREWQTGIIARTLSKSLVWSQEGKLFILDNDIACDAEGRTFEIGSDPIKIAHPIEMKQSEIDVWQDCLLKRGIKQPFEQIWEVAYSPEEIKKSRYKNCSVRFKYLINRQNQGVDAEIYQTYENIVEHIDIKGCELTYHFDNDIDDGKLLESKVVLNSFSFQEFNRQTNHIVFFLDIITMFDRIEKDDVTISSLLPRYNLSQIKEYIKTAQNTNSTGCLAVLMEEKKRRWPDDSIIEDLIMA